MDAEADISDTPKPADLFRFSPVHPLTNGFFGTIMAVIGNDGEEIGSMRSQRRASAAESAPYASDRTTPELPANGGQDNAPAAIRGLEQRAYARPNLLSRTGAPVTAEMSGSESCKQGGTAE